MARILIHTIVFKPDGVSTAYLYADLASELKKYDHDIVVLTTYPHYNYVEEVVAMQKLKKKRLGMYYVSEYDGMKVYHINMRKSKSSIVRIFDFIKFHVLAVCISLALKRLDIVLSPSPPLSIGLVSWFICKLRGGKAIYNVQEVYPDFAINHGFIKNKLIISAVKRLEKAVYNLSKAVVTIDDHFSDIIRPRVKDGSKLHMIPNFVDTHLYQPLNRNNEFSAKHGLDDQFVVGYAGNIGHAQDWDPVLFAANELKHLPIRFLIVGDGVKKKWLAEEISRNNLHNMLLLDYQPRDLMPLINASADIHTITMNSMMDKDGFPSKVYTIMSCARSLIVSTSHSSPLAVLMRKANVPRVVEPNNNEAYKNAILTAFEQRHMLPAEGRSCREFIVATYSKEQVSKQYHDLITKISSQS
jgi:colanic acid biosynthesis glycosyl transferase WcaI